MLYFSRIGQAKTAKACSGYGCTVFPGPKPPPPFVISRSLVLKERSRAAFSILLMLDAENSCTLRKFFLSQYDCCHGKFQSGPQTHFPLERKSGGRSRDSEMGLYHLSFKKGSFRAFHNLKRDYEELCIELGQVKCDRLLSNCTNCINKPSGCRYETARKKVVRRS